MSSKKKDIKDRYFPVPERKMLWGRSGGVCAYCKNSIIDLESSERKIQGQESHIITRDDKEHHRYKDISQEEKDTYKNAIILCATCHHDKTADWTIEQLQTLKNEHEEYVHSLLKGHFKPYIVNGTSHKYRHITYEEIREKRPSVIKDSYIKKIAISSAVGLILGGAFVLLNIYVFEKKEWYLFITFFIVPTMFLFIELSRFNEESYKIRKDRDFNYMYQGKCTFVGCSDGIVTVIKAPKKYESQYVNIGFCDKNNHHTFTVSNDFKTGDYVELKEPLQIINNYYRS